MAVSGDCKNWKNPLRVQIKKCSRHGGCPFFPIYAVCKCDSTGGRLYGIYQYHYGCAAASDGICFTCICMFILFYKVFAKYIDEEPVGEDDPLYGSRE